MKIDGACHCGEIRYEAVIDPEKIVICHCTDCQINSATAFRWGTLVAKEDFVLLAGEPKSYSKTADSGTERRLAFCGTCGTSIYGADAESPTRYSLRLGTARQARELTPRLHIWRKSSLSWIDELNEVPSVDEQDGLIP